MIPGQALPATPPQPVSDAVARDFTQSAVLGDVPAWDLGPFWLQECLTDAWTNIAENESGLAPCDRCGA